MSTEDLEEVLSRELRYVLECALVGNEPRAREKARQAALLRMAARHAVDEQLKPVIAVPLSNFTRKP